MSSAVAVAARDGAPPTSPLRGAILPLAAVYIVWGSTYLAMRYAIQGFPPLLLVSVRFLIAGLLVLGFLAARGARLPDRRQWLAAAPVGTLLFLGGNGFLSLALTEERIGSGVAAVVSATMPLWVAVLAAATGERPRPREWLGVLLGFCAIALLSVSADLGADAGATAFLVLSPLAWAAGSILSRRFSPRGGLLAAASAQMICGGVAALVASLVHGERLTSLPGPRPLLAVAYLVVFGSLIGFSSYTWLLRHARPVLATSHAFVNPLVAVALGSILAGEAITWHVLVGAPLVALAVALAVTARGR